MPYTAEDPLVISSWAPAREAYRSKHLRQGLYDGGVVMENVLINLHGVEHRDRRRLENPLFRRDILFGYERDSFPAVLQARLASGIESGQLELLSFGHRVMLELAAINAGIDIDIDDDASVDRLHDQLLLFIDGARILHFTGDKQAKEREVASALVDFDTEFLQPAITRRRKALAARSASNVGESDVPRDILAVLLENAEGLDLDASTILRETAFFLLTGASTSAAALTMTLDNVFTWLVDHPQDKQRLGSEPAFVQRCIFETLRLEPISPIGARWATQAFTLSDGAVIEPGDLVHIDMRAANRDSAVWGNDAERFVPDRDVPDNVPRHGLSFGHGMHHCIGQELAVGVEPDPDDGFENRIFGLVGVVIQELIANGVRPDPYNPAVIDPLTARRTFARYPVLLAR
ncbi:MAG: cytochrome P450 [Acidimicrobiales bacterium]